MTVNKLIVLCIFEYFFYYVGVIITMLEVMTAPKFQRGLSLECQRVSPASK
jgi:hypothetical protein